MKVFLLIAALHLFHYGNAKKYYFSSETGKDSYTSIQAQNPSTPWRTLSKLNSYISSLQPGDTVLFKRGEIFNGSILIKRSGTPSQRIIFTAYGSGPNPIITSLVRLTNWTFAGNGIWTSNNATFGNSVNVVLINGIPKEMGRYPNSNASNKGYLSIDEFKGTQSITDKDLPASPDWTGAEVVIRKNRWAIDRNKISQHRGSTIYYTSSSPYVAQKGFGYFIQNHIKTLDQFGEWHYQSATTKMSIYFGTSTPSSYTIEASTVENTVQVSNSNYIIFKNLTIKGGNTNSLKISKGRNIEVISCDILFSGRNGVSVSGHTNFKLENCSILHSNSLGIDISGSNNDPIIVNNRIEYTGLFPGMGEIAGPNGTGLQCYSKGATIEYNKIRYCGFNGIAIKLNQTTVKNNFISDFCFIKDDGGGIYSHNGSNEVFAGAKIYGNLIFNGIGAPQGTSSNYYSAEGIYMDDNSNNAEIVNNTATNCSRGIFLHNARNIIVSKNTFYDNEIQFFIRHDKKGDPVRNLVVTNNIFFSKRTTQIVAHFESILDDINSIGHFDQNHYVRPLDDEITIFTSTINSSGMKVEKWYDLDNWKNKYDKDLNSRKTPVIIPPYQISKINSINKVVNGNFNTSEMNLFGNGCTLSLTNTGPLDGRCLLVAPTASISAISLSVGPLVNNKKYLLKYSVIGETNLSLGVNLRYGGYPFKPITPIVYRKISPVRTDYDVLFIPSVTQSLGALIFSLHGTNKYWLDNIQLCEVNATVTDPDDYIRFEYNATKQDKTLILNGGYRDINNRKLLNSIILSPFSSIVLIKEPQKTSPPPPPILVDPINVIQKNNNYITPIAPTHNSGNSEIFLKFP